MDFACQKDAIDDLEKCAEVDRHSILIVGPSGSGKTHIAKHYAKLVNADDFFIIKPSVNEIRETVEAFYELNTRVVLCIENLDTGNPACASVLLKCTEEPKDNIYFVITCTNESSIPDTIISRTFGIVIENPTNNDIDYYLQMYGRSLDHIDKDLRKCVSSFNSADMISRLNSDQVVYFKKFKNLKFCKETISTICWNLSHYADGSELSPKLSVKYIFNNIEDTHVRKACLSCLNDLENNRIAKHLVLSRLAFELKYCE